jgi:hypothetical protein
MKFSEREFTSIGQSCQRWCTGWNWGQDIASSGRNSVRPIRLESTTSGHPHISAEGKAYAYNYNRVLSNLYLVDGLK